MRIVSQLALACGLAHAMSAEDAVMAYTLKGADFHRLSQHQPRQYGIVMLNLARDLARRLRALDKKFWHVSH